jgi:MFS family permease
VADRFSRHKVLIATQSASMVLALFLAALTLTGYVQVWHVLALANLFGTSNAFFIPAQSVFFVDMVGMQDLMNAIALNSSMLNGARIVGPALAGMLVAAVGGAVCIASAIFFALRLPVLVPQARQLILASQMSGDPAEEVTESSITVESAEAAR